MAAHPIDATGSSFREVVRSLADAQKSNVGVSVYSRWVNRPLGRYVAAAAFKWGLTPNQVTAASAVLTFTGIVMLAAAPAGIGIGISVSFLLAAGYVTDSADGQLARLRGGGTPAGEWLDHVVDCIKMATLHVAVLIGWYRYFDLPSDAYLLVALAFAVESSVFFFVLILSEQLRRAATGDRSRPPNTRQGRLQRLQSVAVLPADYGLQLWIFLCWGLPWLFVRLYVVLAVINVALLTIGLARWFREMRRLPPPHRVDSAVTVPVP